ncbi:MAG: glycosyltransferase family 1 protein [Microbacteriaceae bacterium]|nr:glycosyltransferase family 1 protein [Microbacteriaceae bacterium]
MTLLIISPDYASHLYPLAALGVPWLAAGHRVVVATGEATADIVAEFGFERVDLRLSRGSNPGIIRAEEQVAGEDDALRGFFAATRRGMVETLRFQAAARSSDLLWNPLEVARAVNSVVDRVRPDHIIVDHLAFSARLALKSAGHRYADVVLGHPSALPVGTEVYGFPPSWPAAFHPEPAELVELKDRCIQVRENFTAQWNEALLTLDPSALASTDAFAETGDVLLLNYPEALHDLQRTASLPAHAFLGSAVRPEQPDADVENWLADDPAPIIYVSFGSFLSVRSDVLAVVAEALTSSPFRVAFATGSSNPAELGAVPESWLVRAFLPQVRLLGRCALAVTHGGNNSVTEALTFGVPMVVLPFSTDQFAGAASIVAAGVGESFDPNTVTCAQLQSAIDRLLNPSENLRYTLDSVRQTLNDATGATVAYAAITATHVNVQ